MSPRVPLQLTMEYALLGYLKDRPMHGYEIFQHLASQSGLGLIWKIKQSQLYALLDKLAEASFLTSTIEHQSNRPARVMYSITEKGSQAFADWRQTPVSHPRSLRQEFLAKYYYSQQSGGAKELLTKQRAICADWTAQWRSRSTDTGGEDGFGKAIFRYRLQQIEAIDRWIADELSRLGMDD